MQEDPLAALAWMCELELAVLGAALLYVLVRQRRTQALLGDGARPAPGARRVRVLRMVVPACVLAGLFAYPAMQGSDAAYDAWMPAFEGLALALVVAWCSPSEAEVVAGSRGLQVGWSGWSFEALAGGRLQGAELLFDDGGEPRRLRLPP